MKKRLLLISGLILGVAIAFFVPFYFKKDSESTNQTISLTTSIISTFASLLTFSIAIYLFNRYGIDLSITEKKSSKVFQLLELVKETNFSLTSKKLGFWIPMSDPFRYPQTIESYYSEKLLFSEDYIYGLEKIFEISNNPFVPKAIADKVNDLQFSLISYDVDEINQNNYIKVSVAQFKKTTTPKFGRFNMTDMTLLQFLNILNDITEEVKTWLQSNSSIALELNI